MSLKQHETTLYHLTDVTRVIGYHARTISAAGYSGGCVDGAAGVLLRLHHPLAGGQQRWLHQAAALLPIAARPRLMQVGKVTPCSVPAGSTAGATALVSG